MTLFNRRQFLAAMGLASGTLWLPSLSRSWATGDAGAAPMRLIVLMTQHGMWHEAWKLSRPDLPESQRWSLDLAALAEEELSEILRPLHRHRHKLLALDGLALASGEVDREGTRHEVGTRHASTGQRTRPTAGQALPGGPSIDQIVAGVIARPDRFRSLQLAVGPSRDVYGISAADALRPLSPIVRPSDLRARLFGFDPDASSAHSLAAQAEVLGRLEEQYAAMAQKLSGEDRRKLEAHRDLVADLTRRMSGLATVRCEEPALGDMEASYEVSVDAYLELLTTAISCDLSRVFTLEMCTQDADPIAPGFEGDLHFDVAHRVFQNGSAAETMTRYGARHATQVARLLDLLDAVPEGDGTLLDHTLVVWMTDMGDPSHGLDRWSVVLAGGSALPLGRYHHWPRDTPIVPLPAHGESPRTMGLPHQHLLVTVAQACGLDIDAVGVETLTGSGGERIDCTGPLDLDV